MGNRDQRHVFKILSCVLLFLGSAIAALGQQGAEEAVKKDSSSFFIKADSYCEFLNSEAAVDSEHFFEEKMTGDATSACVKRSGAPGSYHYEVMAGQEDIRVSYLSRAAATAYAQWKERGDDLLRLTEANNSDPELKSNLSFFELISNQAVMASTSNATDSWSWENLSWEEKALVGMGGLGFIIGGATAVNRHYSNERMRLQPEERELREATLVTGTLLDGMEAVARILLQEALREIRAQH